MKKTKKGKNMKKTKKQTIEHPSLSHLPREMNLLLIPKGELQEILLGRAYTCEALGEFSSRMMGCKTNLDLIELASEVNSRIVALARDDGETELPYTPFSFDKNTVTYKNGAYRLTFNFATPVDTDIMSLKFEYKIINYEGEEKFKGLPMDIKQAVFTSEEDTYISTSPLLEHLFIGRKKKDRREFIIQINTFKSNLGWV